MADDTNDLFERQQRELFEMRPRILDVFTAPEDQIDADITKEEINEGEEVGEVLGEDD